jgi:hypothetical protein
MIAPPPSREHPPHPLHRRPKAIVRAGIAATCNFPYLNVVRGEHGMHLVIGHDLNIEVAQVCEAPELLCRIVVLVVPMLIG